MSNESGPDVEDPRDEEIDGNPGQRQMEILRRRARRLAQVPEVKADPRDLLKLLSFQLARDLIAIETRYVFEVIATPIISRVPGTPDFLAGVTNRRGEILTVLDLRGFFASRSQTPANQDYVLVLGEDVPDVGIAVDRVDTAFDCLKSNVTEVPRSVSEGARPFLLGALADATLIVDGAALLRDPRLYVDQDTSVNHLATDGNPQ